MAAKSDPSNLEPSLFSYFNEIGIIAQLSGNLFERNMPGGLTNSQFSVLNWFVRVDDVARLGAEVACEVYRGCHVRKVVGKLFRGLRIVAVYGDAATCVRIEALELIAVEAIIPEAIAEGDPCRGRVVAAFDAGPQDADLRATRTVIEACSEATEVLGPNAIHGIDADSNQVDTRVGLDSEQRQGLTFFPGERRFASGHGNGAICARVEFGGQARQ